jgi:ribose/xylose/arabinose/galactoside ABC-type transport system permease subunit
MRDRAEEAGSDLITPGPRRAGATAGRLGRVRGFLESDLVAMSATPFGFAVILLLVYGVWLGSAFLSADARVFDIYQNTPSLLISIGLICCLACGQFDLSAGANASLAAVMTCGFYLKDNLPMPVAIVLAIVIAGTFGVVNAIVVLRFRVNAFIATLAISGVMDGVANVYSGGSDIAPTTSGHNVPTWFAGDTSFGSFIQKVPYPIAIALVVLLAGSAVMALHDRAGAGGRRHWAVEIAGIAVIAAVAGLVIGFGVARQICWQIVLLMMLGWILWVVIRYTVVGRSMFAIGGNPVAARLTGISVNRVSAGAFVVSGLMAGIAGVCLAANQASATPGEADGYILSAYAAVFVSTVFLSVGRFNVWGTVLGGICLVYVGEGLVVGGLQFSWTDVINGLVLLLAVGLSTSIRGMVVQRGGRGRLARS